MFFNIVHDLGLFVTDVKSTCGSVPRRGHISVYIGLSVGCVYIAYALIEYYSSFSTHELEHEY